MAQPNSDIKLPNMGQASSAITSLEEERRLGQAWLRQFRARTKQQRDYLLQEYIEQMVFGMLRYSNIEDKRVDVVVVNNSALNAFAVPGGVIGINTGIFLKANTEAELASIVAHEISHISQRHFARTIENNRNNNVLALAGMLAGVILAASQNNDSGIAMIAASQAASLEAQLKYNRNHEQEADRIGMQLLAKAGYDPNGMPRMFSTMLKGTGYIGYQPPEYLLTHPLTESRVSDSKNRVRQYAAKHYPKKQDFQLLKIKVQVMLSGTPQQALHRFLQEQKQSDTLQTRYALALSYQRALQLPQALEIATELQQQQPNSKIFNALKVSLLNAIGELKQAQVLLDHFIQKNPNSYAMSMLLAENYQHQGQYKKAAKVLKKQLLKRPNDAVIWYDYAETAGLGGDILALHRARAEYFKLTGSFQQAVRQLQYAKRAPNTSRIDRAIIDTEISNISKLREQSPF